MITLRWFRIDTRLAITVIICLAVLALAARFGMSSPSPKDLVPFLAIGGLLVLVRKPELGLLAVLISAISLPYTIGTGTQTELNVAFLLIPVLLVIWTADMLGRRKFKLVPVPANLPLLGLALAVTVSLLAGDLPWNYFAGRASTTSQLGGWAIFIFSAGAFLWVGNQIKSITWLQVFTWIFLILGAIALAGRAMHAAAVAASLEQVPEPLREAFAGRAMLSGTGINLGATAGLVEITDRLVVREVVSGSLFWVWLAALAGGQAVFNHSLKPIVRLALAGLVIAMLGVAWVGYRSWTSGWLPELVLVWMLISLRSWRTGILIGAVGAVLVFVLDPNVILNLLETKQFSTDTRLLALQILLSQVIVASPIIGLGPANYYFYTPLYPILGWYVKFNSHNQYVDILAQTGIVGLVVFTWLMVAIGTIAWRLRARATDGFARGYVYGCLAGLVATLVAGALADWFLPFVYNIGIAGFRASVLAWLCLGGLVSLQRICSRETA